MIIILSIGHTARAHSNPSVTIAFAALSHFPAYIAAQVSAPSVLLFFCYKGSLPSLHVRWCYCSIFDH
ncbi:hypothetical protein Peur_002435 [Populus x canadensis]